LKKYLFSLSFYTFHATKTIKGFSKNQSSSMEEDQVHYSWRFKDDVSRNIRVYEIRRRYFKKSSGSHDDSERPFTVIIYDYTDVRDKKLFSDLFYSDDWDTTRGSDGNVSNDVKFCCELWREFGLDKLYGDFSPAHIEHDLTRAPPKVYRNTLENVMSDQYGCHSWTENPNKKRLILEEIPEEA